MAVGKVDAVLSLKWEIENYLTVSSEKNVGDYLESPKFPADDADGVESVDGISYNNIQWHMTLYPKGKTEEANNHLSLLLHANEEIRAVGTFIIYNNFGQKVFNYSMKEHVFGKTADHAWGNAKCLSRDFIENPANRMLNNKKLTIVCEIRIMEIIKQKIDDPLQRLRDNYEALINDEKFSDVALVSDGKTVRAHKCILAKRSPVFAAMFGTEMRETIENTVEITDVKYDILVEMIRFVYAEKVNDIDALASELAVAADKYALDGLKKYCEQTLMKNLCIGNVFARLQLADTLLMDKLKEKAIKLMIENACYICSRPEFDLLSRNIVREVFQSMANKDN
ncbi:speckle-type POZ protein B [Nasonia vitripennis]|uniref:Roadkill n=1 Tax=Nasonia vitripennis TaxID=7425 RepID=A0A7M7R242_NASVI|nr:speckle-type POZ protein B [Nasonia vitripennis]